MKRKTFFESDSSEQQNKNKKQKTENSVMQNQTPPVIIYWERIYRYVEKFENLYGKNVHVSKGELGSSAPEEYKFVPFSQMSQLGALFEMQEIEEDMLSLACKDHQPGTGVAWLLTPILAPITRIFYDPKRIENSLEKKIMEFAREKKVELVEIDIVDLLAKNPDRIQIRYLPQANVKRLFDRKK